MAHDTRDGRVTIGDIVHRFGRRGHGALLVFLGAPNMLPLPLPGLSAVMGVPLFVLSLGLVAGRDVPRLPPAVARRSFAAEDYRRISGGVARVLTRIERLVRPRLPWLSGRYGRRAMGLIGLILSVTLFLPLPFGNALPGLAFALIGLGLMERDGALCLAGIAIGAVGLAVIAAMTGGAAFGIATLLERITG